MTAVAMLDDAVPDRRLPGDLYASDGTQYLTFELAGECYGVDILQVQEIRGWETATRIPNAPGFVLGVVNLRGTIVPVYDLRMRFGLVRAPYGKETVMIVVCVGHGRAQRSIGMVVDAVSDVLVVSDDCIVPTPEFGASVPTENILGIVSDGERMVMLFDAQRLIPPPSDHRDSVP